MIKLDFYGSHFEYRGTNSEIFDLVFASLETERYEDKMVGVSTVSMYNKKTRRSYIIDSDYSGSCITFDAEIVTCSGRPLTRRERLDVCKWLFNKHDYGRLYFNLFEDEEVLLTEQDEDPGDMTDEYSMDSQRRMYMNCRFLNQKEIYGNNGIIGYRATVETDSPYLWQDEVCRTFRMTGSYLDAKINLNTDADSFIYPRVEVITSDLETGGYGLRKPLDVYNYFVKPNLYFNKGVLAEFQEDETGSLPDAAKEYLMIFFEVFPHLHYRIEIHEKYGITMTLMDFSCAETGLCAGKAPDDYNNDSPEASDGKLFRKISTLAGTRFIGVLCHKKDPEETLWDDVLDDMRVCSDAHDAVYWNTTDEGDYMRVNNIACESRLVVDGNTNYVSPEWIGGFANRGFPRLIDGENTLRLLGRPGDLIRIYWSTRRTL